nr:MAG TPA: hypothetical protein [Caudoviricetes sp.]
MLPRRAQIRNGANHSSYARRRAGGPHPSRCSAKAQHRATFPKGKAKRSEGAGRTEEPRILLLSRFAA